MNRRRFVEVAGGLLARHTFGGPVAGQTDGAEPTALDIGSFFGWKDPAVIRLTEEVFEKCTNQKPPS